MREAGKYVFKVDTRANKIQVMDAVRRLFDVHPVACNIMTVKGKPKRVRYRKGYTATWKKAVVTLRRRREDPDLRRSLSMGIKTYNPTSQASATTTGLTFEEITGRQAREVA